VEELRQNPGENEVPAVTPSPDDTLENVLDAWSSEPSSRQRYDRLRLERRDGESLVLLVDADTARDLGDKLTIVAARARHRSRGASGVPVDRTVDPGDAEDMARARKVLELASMIPGFDAIQKDSLLSAMAEEFRASREDVKKAHTMIDEQRAKHFRELERAREQVETAQRTAGELGLRADRAEAELTKLRGESSIDLSDPSEPAPP
jgi:hypothetical protein